MRPLGVRMVRATARGLGTAAVFVTAVAGGAALHLDVPAVRRTIVARVDQVLASVVAGRIVIERIGSLGAGSVADVDAHVEDPDGKTVLRVQGLDARIATWDLLSSLTSSPDVRIDIGDVSAVSVDVSLDVDEAGTLRLARAFAPLAPTTPSKGGGGGVRLNLPHAKLAHVAVHGRPSPAGPLLEAYVDGTDASVAVAPGNLALQVRHALLAARNLSDGMTTLGTLDARFEQPAPDGSDRFVRVSWRGLAGALPARADGTYDAGRVEAIVDVPEARPECVHDLWASCPFGEVVSAHLEARGTLPHLLVTARGTVGKGAVLAIGQASVGEEVRASVHLEATSVDARALSPSAPLTELGASGDVVLVLTAAGTAGAVAVLDFAGGTVSGARVPPASIDGQIERSAAGALSGQANVGVREPGAPATVALRLSPAGTSLQVAFDASVDVPRLDGMPRLGPVARGSATARARGTLDLGKGELDARVGASVTGVAAGGVALGAASLDARASGPFAFPFVDATLTGSTLETKALRFDRLRAHVKGTPTTALASVSMHGHGADVVGRATVGLAGGATLREVEVTVQRNGESARAQAATVRFGSRETSIDDLEVQGLGSPLEATVRLTPGTLTAKAHTRGLDLARLGNLTGVSDLGGRVSFDVDAAIRRREATGHVSLDLSQGTFAGWKDAKAHVDATLDGLRATGHATGSVGGIGSFDVSSSSLEIGAAGPLEASAWRTAFGEIDVAAHVDLAKLSAQLPKGTIPLGNLAGTVEVKGRVERDSATDSTPDVDLTASTQGLALIGSPVPWRIDGIGATVHTHVDGRTGATAVDAQIADASGALLSLRATSEAVPYRRMFTAAEPIGGALLAMPLRATVTLPSHDIAKLPAFLGTRGMEGMLDAAIDWQGSVDKPTVDLRAMLAHGHAESTVLALQVDVAVRGHYDGSLADVSVQANAKGRPVLDGGAKVALRMADLLGGFGIPWTASARATVTDFPLQSLAALDDRQVRGRANGTFQIDNLHENPKASVELTLTNLQVGEVACRPTTLSLKADGHSVGGSARIVEQDGYAEATAHVGTRWGKELVPVRDPAQPIDLDVTAKNFRAAVLLPFVSQLFTELDGRIDGHAHVVADPAAKTMAPSGTLALSGGVFELAAMGTELHDATAKVTLTPDGVVRLENASARGLSGRIEVAATARLQGQMELASAHALVQIPQKEPLPLVLDGAQVGMVDGRMDVVVERGADNLDVKVGVPSLRVQLPESSAHNVQPLDALADVELGITKRGGEFSPVVVDSGDAQVVAKEGAGARARLTVEVALGKDVEVRRGNDLDVHMEGTPKVTITDAVVAGGQIRLTRGTLNVQGKTFKIDEGSTVTFVGDPTNPQVVLTASWVAPSSDPSASGTTVFADFVGPLKTGKVTLRSQPPLSRTEILSLLLYGTTDQQGGSGGAGSQQVNAATGVAGGAASANINRALGGVNGALDSLGLSTEVSTKIDTSQATPRPEVEVQIARDLTFQIAWVLGVPPPGTNPDSTLFTISWHFLRNWQAETTRGDQGTTILDLVWQRRY